MAERDPGQRERADRAAGVACAVKVHDVLVLHRFALVADRDAAGVAHGDAERAAAAR